MIVLWSSLLPIYILGMFIYLPWGIWNFNDGEYDADLVVQQLVLSYVWPIVILYWLPHRFFRWWFTAPSNKYQGRMK